MQIKEQEDLVPALQEITVWYGKYDVHTHRVVYKTRQRHWVPGRGGGLVSRMPVRIAWGWKRSFQLWAKARMWVYKHFFIFCHSSDVSPFSGNSTSFYFGELPISSACGLSGVGLSLDKEWHPFRLSRICSLKFGSWTQIFWTRKPLDLINRWWDCKNAALVLLWQGSRCPPFIGPDSLLFPSVLVADFLLIKVMRVMICCLKLRNPI